MARITRRASRAPGHVLLDKSQPGSTSSARQRIGGEVLLGRLPPEQSCRRRGTFPLPADPIHDVLFDGREPQRLIQSYRRNVVLLHKQVGCGGAALG